MISTFDINILNFLFFELFHFLFYILILFLIFYFEIVNKGTLYFLLLLSPSPFLFNIDFFQSFFPDTLDYLETIKYQRGYIPLKDNYLGNNKVIYFSAIINYIPLPFIFTKVSLAYISKIIFTMLAIYMFYKNKSNFLLMILILLTPELIMYSSIGLKEMLVIFLMSLSLINYEKKKYIFLIVLMAPLYMIKIQNFYFVLFFILAHQFILFLNINKSLLLKTILISIGFLSIISIFLLNDLKFVSTLLERFDFYCRKLNYDSPTCFNNLKDVIFYSGYGFLNFIFTPLLQKEFAFLYLVQFFSSLYYITILFLLIYFSDFNLEIKVATILYFITIAILFGVLFRNDGLLTRQKFTAIYPFLIFFFVRSNFLRFLTFYNFEKKLKTISSKYKI